MFARIARQFQRALPRWARPEHPVYHLETQRRTQNRSLIALRLGCMPVIFAITGLVILSIMVVIIFSDPFWDIGEAYLGTLWLVVAAIMFIQAIAGAVVNILVIAQATPTISGEVELQSWRLLRTTTLPLREIILAKLAAALSQLRAPFTGLVILRTISLVTGLFGIAYILRNAFYYMDAGERHDFWTEGLWLPITIAIVTFLVFYALQPVIQFVLNGTLGVLASALARSRSRAVAAGLAARLGGWVASILLNVGAIYFLIYLLVMNWSTPYSAPMRAFRDRPEPSDLAIAWVLSLTAIVYILAVLALQIGLTLLALRMIQRRARHLEV